MWAIEQGERKVSSDELTRFADAYGVTASWLLQRANSKARDDRAEIAAQLLSGLSDAAIDRLVRAIRVVKETRGRSVNLPRF